MNNSYTLYDIQEDTFMGRNFIWYSDSAKAIAWPREENLRNSVTLMKHNISGKFTDYDWGKIVMVTVSYDDDGNYHTDFLNPSVV